MWGGGGGGALFLPSNPRPRLLKHLSGFCRAKRNSTIGISQGGVSPVSSPVKYVAILENMSRHSSLMSASAGSLASSAVSTAASSGPGGGVGVCWSKGSTPRPNPAKATSSYVPPDPCSCSQGAFVLHLPRSQAPNFAFARLKRQLHSLAQGPDLHLSALARQIGAPAPAPGPSLPLAASTPATPSSTSSRLLASRSRDAVRSRRHAQPNAASGSEASARAHRDCPAPPRPGLATFSLC